jgi:hypothetical protein
MPLGSHSTKAQGETQPQSVSVTDYEIQISIRFDYGGHY